LDNNGQVDPTFNVGSGANDAIYSIELTGNRIIVAGAFTSFNGQPYAGVVILHKDGSIVPEFKFKNFEGGIPNFAKILSNGKVFVSGNFTKYDGVTRSSLLFLEADGSALQEYNSLGAFSGRIHNLLERPGSLGKFSLMLMGQITRFDNQIAAGLVVLEFDN